MKDVTPQKIPTFCGVIPIIMCFKKGQDTMKDFTAEETLQNIIELFVCYLEELCTVDRYNQNEFIHGEKTAYVECLEIIQAWKNARTSGLNFDIEKKFPI